MSEDCGEAGPYDPAKVEAFLKDYATNLKAANEDGILTIGERNIAFFETAINSPVITEKLGDLERQSLKLQLGMQRAALDTPLSQQETSIDMALDDARQLLTLPDVTPKDCGKGL